MKKISAFIVLALLSGCVMEQPSRSNPNGQTVMQPSFHPTLYVSPGTVGGVSNSTYTVTPL